jgi:DinB superfamily
MGFNIQLLILITVTTFTADVAQTHSKKYITITNKVEKKASLNSVSNSGLSVEERNNLTSVLNRSLEKFNLTVDGLSEEQFNYRMKPSEWTIAECIEHITLAELRFPKIVEEEMKKPADPEMRKKVKIADDAIRGRITNRFWKARSPEVLKPTGSFTTTELALKLFRKQRKETLEYINSTNDDLRNHFWEHRATGIIDLYQTLILMSGHLERHIAQIEEIKSSKRFPKK